MEPLEIEVVRSARKTVGLEVRPDGRVILRAPKRMSQKDIRAFVASHRDWLDRHLARVRERAARAESAEKLTPEELRALARRAKAVIPERVAYYAPLVGVTYGRIAIRSQRTRWGSCSAKGNLNFNCLLILAPPEVMDSVVVHELCHRLEMNHSPRFYAEVNRVFPEYKKWHGWLREHGGELLARLPE